MIANNYRRGAAVWHRRAGKDKTALNLLVKEAFLNPGIYYYFFPSYAQGRKIIWDGMDSSGFKFLNHIPEKIIALNDDGRVAINNTEMKVRIHTQEEGKTSLIQVVGCDNYDSIVGTNPRGCVFSEFAIQNPMAWRFIEPILMENMGWAVFIYTPRGRNHGYDIYSYASESQEWFCQLLTVDETRREDGSPVVTPEMIEEARRSGMSEDTIRQEFYCDFNVGAHGSFYGMLMADARKEGRIAQVVFDPRLPVHTAWDLGYHGDTAIWFFQHQGQHVNLLRYIADNNKDIPYYAALIDRIQREEQSAGRMWRYGKHFAPHDARIHELGSGMRRSQIAREAGLALTVIPKMGRAAGIEYVKWLLPSCRFDATGCPDGIKCLEMYQREWDDDHKVFRETPKSNWAAHGADAFRILATAVQRGMTRQTNSQEAIDLYLKFGPPRMISYAN